MATGWLLPSASRVFQKTLLDHASQSPVAVPPVWRFLGKVGAQGRKKLFAASKRASPTGFSYFCQRAV